MSSRGVEGRLLVLDAVEALAERLCRHGAGESGLFSLLNGEADAIFLGNRVLP
jgi:hypothetical protein